MVKSRRSPPSSRGPGRSPFKAKTRVRISLGAQEELLIDSVEQFFAYTRFEGKYRLTNFYLLWSDKKL